MSAFGDAAYKAAAEAKVKAERALQSAQAKLKDAQDQMAEDKATAAREYAIYSQISAKRTRGEVTQAQYDEAFHNYQFAIDRISSDGVWLKSAENELRDAQADYNEAFANWRQAAQMLE